MNESVLLGITFTRRELRFYAYVIGLFLVGLFGYNAFTMEPSFSSSQLFFYGLLTLGLLAEYMIVFSTPIAVQILNSNSVRSVLVLIAFEILFIVGFIQVLGSRATPYVFVLIFDVYALAIATPRRLALAGAVGTSVVVGVAYITLWGWQTGLSFFWPAFLWIGVAIFGAESLVRQWRQREQVEALLAELEEAHRQVYAYARQAEDLSIARERARIAHELHDTIGHTLTALDVQMELLVHLPAGETAARRKAAQQARSLVKQGMAGVRRAVQALQPLALETFSLTEAIGRLVADFERTTQILVVQEVDCLHVALSPAQAVPLYYATLESLTNIQRHAPDVTHVTICLRYDDDSVTLVVQNNGLSGAAVESSSADLDSGHGLRGLCERAEALGGHFQAGPVAPDLFRVQMTLPLAVGA